MIMFLHKLFKKPSNVSFFHFQHYHHISTVVMSFGDASHGALGLSSPNAIDYMMEDAYEPTLVTGLPNDVCSIGAGHYHSMAVTEQGKVWTWGRNNEFQLGRGTVSNEKSNQPMMVKGLDQVKVKSVSASGVVSTATGEDGSLWVWGKSKRGQLGLGNGVIQSPLPSRVQALAGEHIVKVSLGWGHALACTKEGKLYGWGYAPDGRIGLNGLALETENTSEHAMITKGESVSSLLDIADKMVLEQMEKENEMPILWEPSLINELKDVNVVDVACGDDHSLLLCDNGTLLSSGSNTYGQLGRSSDGLGLLPVDIKFLPLSVSSGLGHCLAVCQSPSTSESNNVVTWGWNTSSQLGRKGLTNIPKLVDGLKGEAPVSASGGRVHSIVLTSKGEVFIWGCGRNGRLGLGSSSDEVEPVLLDSLEGFKVLQAVSGYDHNIVLVAQ